MSKRPRLGARDWALGIFRPVDMSDDIYRPGETKISMVIRAIGEIMEEGCVDPKMCRLRMEDVDKRALCRAIFEASAEDCILLYNTIEGAKRHMDTSYEAADMRNVRSDEYLVMIKHNTLILGFVEGALIASQECDAQAPAPNA